MSDAPTPEVAVKPVLLNEPLDIQHDTDPAEDHGPARRIPHLGHAILFFSLLAFFMLLAGAVIYTAMHLSTEESVRERPGLSLLAEAAGYVAALLVSIWLFPRLWLRSFWNGIQWNALAARRRWFWLMPGAVLLSFAAQYADTFSKTPTDDDPILKMMLTPHGAWAMTIFGVLLAPLVEEIAFRGFLLPALATAYDWLALERTPAGLQKWENSTMHSAYALGFAAVFSSVPFALMHASQLSRAWGALSVLYAVSLVFSAVRIRNHSVACSVLMHMTYNLTAFVVAFVVTGGYRHLEKLAQ